MRIKGYRITYVLKRFFKKFGKYNPKDNHRCMIQNQCKNKYNIAECGTCWRADRYKSKY